MGYYWLSEMSVCGSLTDRNKLPYPLGDIQECAVTAAKIVTCCDEKLSIFIVLFDIILLTF